MLRCRASAKIKQVADQEFQMRCGEGSDSAKADVLYQLQVEQSRVNRQS